MLIMGAVLAGGEFRWGTWGTLLTQGPSRTTVVLAKLSALAVALAGVVVATFVTVGAVGAVLAVVEDRAMAWPSPGRIAAGLGCAWLVSLAAASLGFALAMLFRGVHVVVPPQGSDLSRRRRAAVVDHGRGPAWGRVIVRCRPPAGRGMAVASPRWACAMARTIDRPRPKPRSPAVRARSSRRNGCAVGRRTSGPTARASR